MLESRLSPDARPQTLLAYDRRYPWVYCLSLRALPGGGIFWSEMQGDDVRHATLPFEPHGTTGIIRLTYSWDAPGRSGRLTLEQPEINSTKSVALPPPHPMSLDDVRAMVENPYQREMDSDVDFFAISDRIEPVGPMPTLTGAVPVDTPQGFRTAGQLKRGSLVRTDAGQTVPVLQAVKRTVPARGSFRPVYLRAPYFGLRRDVVVAPQQRLVLSGSEVEYMFGSEAVLVPARHLINGVSARYAQGPDLVTYHQLLLPGHEAILAAGCPVESLYIGRLRRKPDELAASVLNGTERSGLPEHPQPVWPVLKPFEAITLAMKRAA